MEVLTRQWPAESWNRPVSQPSQSALSPGDQTLLCSRTSFWRPGRAGIKTGAIPSRQWRPDGEASLLVLTDILGRGPLSTPLR